MKPRHIDGLVGTFRGKLVTYDPQLDSYQVTFSMDGETVARYGPNSPDRAYDLPLTIDRGIAVDLALLILKEATDAVA